MVTHHFLLTICKKFPLSPGGLLVCLLATNETNMQYYYVYITTNPGRTTLYIGITNSLARRMREHWDRNSASRSFAAGYRCYNLIYFEVFQSRNDAIHREKSLKGIRRERKEALIDSQNPEWSFYPWWEWPDSAPVFPPTSP